MKFSQELAYGLAFAAREFFAEKVARSLLRELLAMSQEEFSAAFQSSPMKRAKLRGLHRSAAIVGGNDGTAADVNLLARMLVDLEPFVHEHDKVGARTGSGSSPRHR